MKTCPCCGVSKPLSDYSRTKSRSSGHQHKCKVCHYAANRDWRLLNRGKCNSHNASYKSSKRQSTPNWADVDQIRKTYELAKWVSTLYNKPFEVDHIVPLRGKAVCGLHVENNLQILPMNDNRSKSNKLIEEHP